MPFLFLFVVILQFYGALSTDISSLALLFNVPWKQIERPRQRERERERSTARLVSGCEWESTG